jgi:cobalt-zinc-cadmium efflux system protein
MASDAILSLAVVLGGGAMIVWGIPWIDSVLSLIFAAVILVMSTRLLKTSFASLMDRTDPIRVKKLSQIVLDHPDVLNIHDIHLINPSSKEHYFSAHIILNETMSLSDVESVIETLRHDLYSAGATHILLQPETIKYNETDAKQCSAH